MPMSILEKSSSEAWASGLLGSEEGLAAREERREERRVEDREKGKRGVEMVVRSVWSGESILETKRALEYISISLRMP